VNRFALYKHLLADIWS